MTPSEVKALAETVIRQRLEIFQVIGTAKGGRALVSRFEAPLTPEERQWEALLASHRRRSD